MGEVDWGPALAVLAGGLVIGGADPVAHRRKPAPALPARPEDTLERRDLDGRLEGLVGQLRELEDTGGKRTEAARAERSRSSCRRRAP